MESFRCETAGGAQSNATKNLLGVCWAPSDEPSLASRVIGDPITGERHSVWNRLLSNMFESGRSFRDSLRLHLA